MLKNTLPPLIIEPPSKANSAIIWLHGLGANAHDFEGIIPLLPTKECSIRMIFPNAPMRPVTINNGFVMPAWYDITDPMLKNSDKAGIMESMTNIASLIDEQIKLGIAAEKIILAGFSQGGAMALHTGFRYTKPLAGIIALSCYVLEREQHDLEVNNSNKNVPVWMAHGSQDSVVPYSLGKDSAIFLTNHGHSVNFVSYLIAHEVSIPEINDLSKWLSEKL